jgi:uncharacterized membrane protein
MADSGLIAVFLIAGLTLSTASVPLALRKVPPNPLMGYRTPATLANPALWYDANAKVGVYFCVVGLGLVALSIAAALSVLSETSLIVSALIWLPFGTLSALVHGGLVVARAGLASGRSG